MSTAELKERIAEASPHFKARITAVFYLVTILMGGVVLFVHGRLGLVFDLIAAGCYIALTALFYKVSRWTGASLRQRHPGLRRERSTMDGVCQEVVIGGLPLN